MRSLTNVAALALTSLLFTSASAFAGSATQYSCRISKFSTATLSLSAQGAVRFTNEEYDRDRDGQGVYLLDQHTMLDSGNALKNVKSVESDGSIVLISTFDGVHGSSKVVLTLAPMDTGYAITLSGSGPVFNSSAPQWTARQKDADSSVICNSTKN